MNTSAFDVATYAQFAYSAKGNIQIFVQPSDGRPTFELLDQFREIAETLVRNRSEQTKAAMPYEANVYYDTAYEQIVIAIDAAAPELDTLTKFVDAATGYLALVINRLRMWLPGTRINDLFLNIFVFMGLAGRNAVADSTEAAPWPNSDRLFDTYVPIDQETADKFHPIAGSAKGMEFLTGYSKHIARITQYDELARAIRSDGQARLASVIANYIRDTFTYSDRVNISDRSFLTEIAHRHELREAALDRDAALFRATIREQFPLVTVV